jgi:hypothetical protein
MNFDVLEYLGDNPITIDEFNRNKFEPIIPISQIKVDPKIVTYWRREKLLPFIPEGKWARLSYIQILWIWVLNAAREIGLPVKRLHDLKFYFFDRALTDDVAKKNLEYNIKRLEDKAKLAPLTVKELELLTQIKRDLSDEATMESYRLDINYFSNLVTESVLSMKEGGIQIFKDTIVEYVETGYRTFPKRDLPVDILNEPHFIIPLQNFLKKFINESELNSFGKFIDFPNPDEIRILKEFRKKHIESITITRSNNDRDIRIDTTSSRRLTNDEIAEIKNLLQINNYERITLDTVDHKNIIIKRTKKQTK